MKNIIEVNLIKNHSEWTDVAHIHIDNTTISIFADKDNTKDIKVYIPQNVKVIQNKFIR